MPSDEIDSTALKQWFEEIKHEALALWLVACKLISKQEYTLQNGKTLYWNMLPYDVQVIWALALHDWNISEMKTWEGKTLVATAAAYLNALSWYPVHIVTVNDYLASRDAHEMWVLYKALWMSVWVIHHEQDREEKKENYHKDIVYATNNELGFDYLRDNMTQEASSLVMGKKFFAIIDEVDSILIDEARTPLVISMPESEPTEKYERFAKIAKKLSADSDYKIDEKAKTSTLTDSGIKKIEAELGVENIYVSERYNDLHHIENALRAMTVYIQDKDYILQDDQLMIVDEHTGRVLPGRRYGDGLHQALEAKEGVPIQQESKTLASITFQNYFRMYWKLSGMTGTAKTEEEEFYKVYGLETICVPTNLPIVREDKPDLLFKNEKWKFEYVIAYIQELHKSGRPILVGTVSVDKSEYLSTRLREVGIDHNVLNAKYHEKEAEIIAEAGAKWAVTIATNMAGRGTDIKLRKGVVELGGLVILGTEKHETRRIDNQLRGRAGRQWDPGMTQFLISPNDDIMRIFGWDKLFGIFNSPMFASLPDNEPLTQSSMLTRRVVSVQKQVEGHNFDARKHILEYDDVINKHREIIYRRRNDILKKSENTQFIDTLIWDIVARKVKSFVLAEEGKREPGDPLNTKDLVEKVHIFLGRNIIDDILEKEDVSAISQESTLADYIAQRAASELDKIRWETPNEAVFYELVKKILLLSLDKLWMNHIDAMNKLRWQVAFLWYAQKQPLMVYKEKAFEKFENLLSEIDLRILKSLFSIKSDTQVQVVKVDDTKMQIQNWEWSQNHTTSPKQHSWGNPLFAQPQTWPNRAERRKKKIRV